MYVHDVVHKRMFVSDQIGQRRARDDIVPAAVSA